MQLVGCEPKFHLYIRYKTEKQKFFAPLWQGRKRRVIVSRSNCQWLHIGRVILWKGKTLLLFHHMVILNWLLGKPYRNRDFLEMSLIATAFRLNFSSTGSGGTFFKLPQICLFFSRAASSNNAVHEQWLVLKFIKRKERFTTTFQKGNKDKNERF